MDRDDAHQTIDDHIDEAAKTLPRDSTAALRSVGVLLHKLFGERVSDVDPYASNSPSMGALVPVDGSHLTELAAKEDEINECTET